MITQKVPHHSWQNAMNVGSELVKEEVTDCTVVSISDFFHFMMCDAGTNISPFIYCYILNCLPHRDMLLVQIEVSS